ncbi:MAG: glycoside hydrolase family 9 protein [Bacteroidales bacterium]|nr:glycoside hydrolase family 9 protein [Bacteroidales bacterium]
MKNHFLILLSIILFSCNTHKNSSEFDSFPLAVPEENSLMVQWEKKTVLDSRLIDDMEHDTGWTVTGIGEMSYTQDRAKDGKQSLRFRTSLRDTAFYRLPRNRSEWNSFIGGQGGSSSVVMNFNTPQDWSEFNRISFWVYVHPTSMPTYCIYLGIENKETVYNTLTPGKSHFVQDLKPGMWNHVLFEIPHIEREKVTLFSITQMLRGHNPEEEGIVTYDFDKLELQRVVADQYEGWTVAPEKFSFSHVGYRPGDLKIALVGSDAGDNFQLINQNDSVTFSGNIEVVENKNGVFHQLDFSDLHKEGIYRIRCGNLESNPFPVNEDIWIQPVFKAINFFFCERCGYAVPGIHLACHKDWQGFRGEEKKIINGGWHDAGDLSQGYWRTAMATFAMMRNLEILEERKDVSEVAERIRSEIAWGLEWLLKTRFGDGFHMSWSTMRIYTDNQVGTIDDVVSPAQNVPWENFLGAAVLSKAAVMLEKSHPELAGKARVAAVEDWQAGVVSREIWDQAGYQEAAWGVTSSLLLGEMTGEEKYKEQAIQFGRLLLQCQEQNFLDGIPITGYFYTNTNRQRVIHNNHAAFEEAPLIALTMLCREFPEHENWIDWYSAVVLHSEFFMKRGSQIASPYDLLPNSVWKKSEIMAEKDEKRREINLQQFNDGTPLNEEYVLRTFPIWRDATFHGNTNIHMSGTWALAEAVRLRNDSKGMQLVGKQLEWVFGANPFGQSLMYGTGYDFAPHFAYCLKDVVGSLPVGMDCMSGDKPYWSASNYATYKEIWVEPVSRFLGAVSVYYSQDQFVSQRQELGKNIQVQTESIQSDNGVVAVMITITGKGKHEIEIKAFNAKANFDKKQIDLSGNKTEKIDLELNVIDRNKPYVSVISVDKNPDLRKEIVGSFIKP